MDEKRTEDVLPLSAEEASPAPKTKARPDKALVKAEIRQGKADGAQYLKEKRACSSLAETKAFRKKWRQQKKAWKAEYKTLDEEQRAARKKGRRAFRHRIHRTGRIFKTLIAVLLILCLLGFGLPAAVTSWRIYKSQKFTNSGAEEEIARVKGYALSEEIRGEGIVLLKNEGEQKVLPLQKGVKTALIGPYVDCKELHSSWHTAVSYRKEIPDIHHHFGRNLRSNEETPPCREQHFWQSPG